MGNSASKAKDINPDEDLIRDDEPTPTEPDQLSYYAMAKQGYLELVHAIIRPPRCNYEMSQLGPNRFDFGGKSFVRNDFEVSNVRGMKVVCSMWEPTKLTRQNNVLPCVIYMHGNSSARVEALGQLSLVLSLGATLVSFDFCGSGKSDGDWVSLGAFEKDDLKCVIEYLRNSGTTSTIALWGRSMGAATSLLHGERDPSIAGMVLDSAFADLTMLAEEMVEKGRKHGLFAPGFVVKLALRFIRSSVLKKAEFDIRLCSPIEHADRCFIPALFVAAEGDEFVPPHHSQKIYAQYAGDKNVIIVEGDHNSNRPKFLYDSASIFLVRILQIPDHWILCGENDKRLPTMGLPWDRRRTSSKSRNHTESRGATGTSAQGRRSSGNSVSLSEVDMGMGNEEIGEEIGMSKQKQDEVRSKIYSMLGDRGSVSAASSSSNKGVNIIKAGDSRHEVNSPLHDINSPIGNIEDSPILNEEDITLSLGPWTCDMCTLINDSQSIQCFACDNLRVKE
mmetsp:Transcript_31506/g.30070  ORF Transcript_31506/g.30070 Transcript_31506/m.30070 type:complete len:505 (+) Transcript_31506:100-1614(+)